jgi:hypothetical protein
VSVFVQSEHVDSLWLCAGAGELALSGTRHDFVGLRPDAKMTSHLPVWQVELLE